MPPDRQKTFSELTKTALGRTEQTTGNFFSGSDSKSLITEAWHTNRPKTEQEIIDEITSKTTSEVVKKSILDGVGECVLSASYWKICSQQQLDPV